MANNDYYGEGGHQQHQYNQGYQHSSYSAYSSQPYDAPPTHNQFENEAYSAPPTQHSYGSNAPEPSYGQAPYTQSHESSYGHQSYEGNYPQQAPDNSYAQQPYDTKDAYAPTYPVDNPPQYEHDSYNHQYPPTTHSPYPPTTHSPYPPSHTLDYNSQPPYSAPTYNTYGAQVTPIDPYAPTPQNQYTPHIDPNAPLVPNAPDADRGLMGAVAGAAIGGYGGHKVNHGFLGAVGGAYAGHKLQDHIKAEKKKKKKQKHSQSGHRRDSSSSSNSSSSDDDKKKKKKNKHGAPVPVPVSHHTQGHATKRGFSTSSQSITLDADYDLIASCRRIDGTWKLSAISLNNLLTNHNGQFRWSKGGDFGATARHVRLVEGGRVLVAELGTGGHNGGWQRTSVLLDERIANVDGELVYLD